MIRTLTGIGLALALVGSAHAQDSQVTVRLDGKSQQEVRQDVRRAAEKVCEGYLNSYDTGCVEATYIQAMQDFRAASQANRLAYQRTSIASTR